jgi:methionyl-tRNA formyltransferase
MVGEERVRIWKATLASVSHASRPGTVLAAGKRGIDIATGRGVLRLLELQRPGKRRMSVDDYLNAVSLPERLEPGNL